MAFWLNVQVSRMHRIRRNSSLIHCISNSTEWSHSNARTHIHSPLLIYNILANTCVVRTCGHQVLTKNELNQQKRFRMFTTRQLLVKMISFFDCFSNSHRGVFTIQHIMNSVTLSAVMFVSHHFCHNSKQKTSFIKFHQVSVCCLFVLLLLLLVGLHVNSFSTSLFHTTLSFSFYSLSRALSLSILFLSIPLWHKRQ